MGDDEIATKSRDMFKDMMTIERHFENVGYKGDTVILGINELAEFIRFYEPAEPQWQPIETAPANVKVLLYCPDRGCQSNKERIELDYAKFGQRIDGISSSMSFHSWATHWMPLPKPPKKED